jgi:hypothetical protein
MNTRNHPELEMVGNKPHYETDGGANNPFKSRQEMDSIKKQQMFGS